LFSNKSSVAQAKEQKQKYEKQESVIIKTSPDLKNKYLIMSDIVKNQVNKENVLSVQEFDEKVQTLKKFV
jgi:hypothetical protein